MTRVPRGLRGLLASILLSGCSSSGVPGQAPGVKLARESTVTEIKDLAEILPAVSKEPGKRTLVVFDVDDTLLTSETFFGSDYWYEWQKRLGHQDPGSVPCRFDVTALNYETGTMRPTQEDGPRIVDSIKGDRHFGGQA